MSIATCFFFSGAAALVYQTAWVRQFAVVFGTSDTAVAAVLSAYMGSLALGCWLAERHLINTPNPLFIYALLEAGIAVGALLVPSLQSATAAVYVGFFGHQPILPAAGSALATYQWIATVAVLAFPVGCMGATWPVIVRHVVQTDASIGPKTGLFYALNTAGAVVGTLSTAYVLLPNLGLQSTIWLAAAINGAVCPIALLLHKRAEVPVHPSDPVQQQPDRPTGRTQLIVLLVALSGSISFFFEVFWTRLLSPTMGGTIAAFATMLAAFLSGLTVGGALAGRLGAQARRAGPGFAAALGGTALFTLASYEILCALSFDQLEPATQTAVALAALFPSAVCIGATFPLAVRAHAQTAREAAHATAQLFTWNTIGAIAGSLLAGFYLLPQLGFATALRWAISLSLVLMLIALWRLCALPALYTRCALLATGLALAIYTPSTPTALLNASAIARPTEGETLFSRVGKAANVLLYASKGSFYLRTNGLPEASVRMANSPPGAHSTRWLMALPLIARPDARSGLVVGWGGGVLLEDLPPTLRSVDVAELEPEVIEANRHIGDARHSNPLDDPRIRIVLNDARGALALSDKRYDLIVSQPSHPWTAGASHLYTSEFVEMAKGHLEPEGVFVQWIGTPFVDLELMRALCATLLEHFSYLRVYQPSRGMFILLASDSSLQLEQHVHNRASQPADWQDYLRSSGIFTPEDLLLTLTLDEVASTEFTHRALPISDNDNALATRPHVRDQDDATDALLKALERYDPILQPNSWIHSQLGPLRLDYIAHRLIQEGDEQRALRLAQSVSEPTLKFLIQGYGLQQQGKPQAALAAFAQSLAHESDNHSARYAGIASQQAARSDSLRSAEDPFDPNTLPTSAQAVLQGQAFARQKDWVRLAKLEQTLATVQATEGWLADAILLRALWRRHLGALVGDQNVLWESIQLIDRLLGRSHKAQLLFLRQDVLAQLGDTQAYIATAWQTHRHVTSLLDRSRSGAFSLPKYESNMLKHQLDNTLSLLRDEPFKPNSTLDLRVALHAVIDSLRLP